MICSDCIITGDVRIHPDAVVHPKITLVADEGSSSTLGQYSIVEELCTLRNSALGPNCLVEVGSYLVETAVGSSTILGPKCKLSNCTVGSGCTIGALVIMNNVIVPDNSVVYMDNGEWVCRPRGDAPAQDTTAYREKLVQAESAQCLTKSFARHSVQPCALD